MRNKRPYRLFSVLKGIFSDMPIKTGLVICCLIFTSFYVKADDDDVTIDIKLDPIGFFDDVPVEFVVDGYLQFETNVIITEGQKVYIAIDELFKNLGIQCVSENQGNNLTGFIENESKTYSIDFDARQILVGKRTIRSEHGFMKESGVIYIESTVITEAFGFDIIFNFRSLSIKMDANFELPVLKQMRMDQIRQNVSILQSNSKLQIDTVIGRDYHLFRGGIIDWSASLAQSENEYNNNRFSLRAGVELLYGEATVGFDYYSLNRLTEFDNRQLYYNWRWVDNDNPVIKQAQLGKVGVQSIAYLSAPLVGASINNSPNTIRKASGTYTISDYTEPNWTVELYINDALVDYTAADASGFYLFEVPNVYGYTTLKLKFYGPMGEERIEERTMNVPYTFMPAKTLEYSVTGGVLEDRGNSKFGRGVVNYGLNKFITIGSGVEYLSDIPENPLIPFAIVSFQPFSRMIINLEYDHNVVFNSLLNYTFGKSTFLELDYSNFTKGQQATLDNTNEKLKARFSFPFRVSKIMGNTQLTYNQFIYDNFDYFQLNAVFSGRYKNYSANTTFASNWTNERDPFINVTLDLSYRMRNGLMIRPTAQYDITMQEMMRIGIEFEKRIDKMSFSASYERNFQYDANNVYLTLRYDLPFARAGVTASSYNNRTNISEYAQGSLAFGGDNNYVNAGNNSAVGRGGILLYPFLDLNQNGTFDEGEQMVLLTNVRVSGAKAFISETDSIVRISDLNAFIDYTVQFSDNDLNNIAWRFKHKTYQILVDPNQYKKVYVPINSVGEVSGTVYLKTGNNVNGLGRIKVQIIDKKGVKIIETLSESDGYFNYLGLNPGTYTVRMDENQLDNLGYQSAPLFHDFVIKEAVDGDIVDGLDFVLQPIDTTSAVQNSEKGVLKSDENVNPTEAIKEIKPDTIGGSKLPEKVLKNDSLDINKSVLDKPSASNLNNQKENPKIAEVVLKEKTKTNINTIFTDVSKIDKLFYRTYPVLVKIKDNV